MIAKIDAILSLVPSAEVTVIGKEGDEIVWHSPSTAPVTNEQINNELLRLQAIENANQYQRDRALEYPSLPEQLDMLYHDKINNTNIWLETIQAVKDKYPKS